MRRAVAVVIASCVVAFFISNLEVEGQFGYGGYGAGYGGGFGGGARRAASRAYYQNYYQDYAQQVLLRRQLNQLIRAGDFARYVNFLPFLLALLIFSNRTSLPINGNAG